MNLIDISRTLSNDLAPWPGDTPFRFELKGRIEEGSSVNVGAISMSLHNGTHGDAKFHFDSAGWKIDQAELATYVGPAVVVDLSARYAGSGATLPQIGIAELERCGSDLEAAPRLLIKTNVWPDSRVFPPRIPVIAPGVAEWLGEKGVTLLGLDVPSVDEIDAKKLVNHHALGRAGISIIESLDLTQVSAGVYQFVALPLKIAGADGSPLRAILWRE